MANRHQVRQEGEAVGSGPRGTATTYIDESCELSGQLQFKDTVRIDGRVEGEIEGPSGVIIGKTGRIRAKIQSDTVVVQGTVEGDIFARSKITLHETARVEGELRSAGIIIEDGAQFTGGSPSAPRPTGSRRRTRARVGSPRIRRGWQAVPRPSDCPVSTV